MHLLYHELKLTFEAALNKSGHRICIAYIGQDSHWKSFRLHLAAQPQGVFWLTYCALVLIFSGVNGVNSHQYFSSGNRYGGLFSPTYARSKSQSARVSTTTTRKRRNSEESSTDAKIRKLSPWVINTAYGDIRGMKVDVDHPDCKPVVQYLGIPYAAPPTGNRRWKKPMDKYWRGTWNATSFGAVCPQSWRGPLPNVLLPVWYRPSSTFMRQKHRGMSEDCLYLNIYVPAKLYALAQRDTEERQQVPSKDRLPVMIFFHGHTFSEGSGNLYDGSLLASYGEVIVVTFNYRLGILGFMSTLDENSPGNYGLWDQIKVLKWISENIEFFGGDPDRVTAFGSGAGSASIGLLMLSVHTEGYFRRAIYQSGTALAPWCLVKKPRDYARRLARRVECVQDTKQTNTMVTCLRNKHWRELLDTQVNPAPFDLAFGPVVDGGNKLLSDTPINLMKKGEFLNFETMIGVSQGEGFGYVRDRLKASSAFNSSTDDNFSYFSSKNLYKKKNFNLDVTSFVDYFYSGSDVPLKYIEDVVKFMYTDWVDENDPTRLKKSLMDLYTDRQWVEPAVHLADTQAKFNHPAYMYTFYHHPGSDKDRTWVQSAHGEQLPFVFGAPLLSSGYPLFPYNFTDTDVMISVAVMNYWTNFAKNGDPVRGISQETDFIGKRRNCFHGVEWPRYDTIDRPNLHISTQPAIGNHYRAEKVALWGTFLPRLAGIPEHGWGEEVPISTPPTRPPTQWGRTKSRIWTPNPKYTNTPSNQIKDTEPRDSSGMSLELTITLVVGFVLLCVNIIAFAVVSYHAEKDKYKIEKLRTELKSYRKRKSYNKNGGKAIPCGSQAPEELDFEREAESNVDGHVMEGLVNANNKTPVKRLNLGYSTLSPKSEQALNGGYTLSPHSEPLYRTLDLSLLKPGYSGISSGGNSDFKGHSNDRDVCVVGLTSPRKVRDDAFSEAKSADSIGDVAFLSHRKGVVLNESDVGRESETNYWSRSDCGDDSGASGSYNPTQSEISEMAHVYPNPARQKSTVISPGVIGESSRSIDKQGLRCKSAMSMFARPEHEYAQQEFCARSNVTGSLQRGFARVPARHAINGHAAQYQTTPRLNYHGSIQNLPPIYAKAIQLQPQWESFCATPTKPCSQSEQPNLPTFATTTPFSTEDQKPDDSDVKPPVVSTYSSVTTKL